MMALTGQLKRPKSVMSSLQEAFIQSLHQNQGNSFIFAGMSSLQWLPLLGKMAFTAILSTFSSSIRCQIWSREELHYMCLHPYLMRLLDRATWFRISKIVSASKVSSPLLMQHRITWPTAVAIRQTRLIFRQTATISYSELTSERPTFSTPC